jgi:hypothetical protein
LIRNSDHEYFVFWSVLHTTKNPSALNTMAAIIYVLIHLCLIKLNLNPRSTYKCVFAKIQIFSESFQIPKKFLKPENFQIPKKT